MSNFDDKPIKLPSDDKFGFDPFARTIAKTISELVDPEGSVISITGPWGTGKSSVVNLVKYHLSSSTFASDLTIVNFNCWWFRGEDALALEFFRQLYAAIDINTGTKAKDAISKLGSRILSGSSAVVGAAVNLTGAIGAGELAAGGMNFLSNLIKQDETVESFHQKISEELKKSKSRILIIVDDIDRLSPDEAILVFRLIKSVGRLPNVIYLLAYDRAIAERVVTEKYPSEGAQYLEKIIQAGFDLPAAPHASLFSGLIDFINVLWKDQKSPDHTRFWNLMHDVVSPLLESPRDVIRVMNTLKVSWQAVKGEVDQIDFLCIEALRILRPAAYNAIRANKGRLTNSGLQHRNQNTETVSALYDAIFLSEYEKDKRDALKTALRRLFPALNAVWGNMSYSRDSLKEWELNRLVCCESHFETYFQFSVSDINISRNEIDFLIANCGDSVIMSDSLINAKQIITQTGITKAAKVLDELIVHSSRIPIDKAMDFLSAIFATHDELQLKSDEGGGFAISSNNLRVHWLLRAIVIDRTTLLQRSTIITNAAKFASLGWLVDLASSAYRQYHPREDERLENDESGCLTIVKDAITLRRDALKKIEGAARDGTLLRNPCLLTILFRWDEFSENTKNEKAKRWCKKKLNEDDAIVIFASIFTSKSWSHSMGGFGSLGDTVAVQRDRVSVSTLERFFDTVSFRKKCVVLMSSLDASTSNYSVLSRFLAAWDASTDSDG